MEWNLVDEVYFHDKSGVYKGYIEKIFNDNKVNVLVDDTSNLEGYQVWRVEDYFLSKSPEEALAKWIDYKKRLEQFKVVLDMQRKSKTFFRGVTVLVESFKGPPYKAMVLKLGKTTLDVVTEDKRYKRVDKAIAKPIPEILQFY